MKFWQRLFGKKRTRNEQEEDWEEVVYTREGVDFQNPEERAQYLDNCLEQMTVAAKELELLSGEYSIVTAYLMDTEEVEALPAGEQESLTVSANRLFLLEKERREYLDKKDRMSDSLYYGMKDKEGELEEGIHKLKDAEQFQASVKQDMQRLTRERQAYAYRKDELYIMMENQKGMILIFFIALVVCILILAVLQFGFGLQVVVGYFAAVVTTALIFTVIWVKYVEAGKELHRVEKANNRLIQLQNRVKIKYVNNTNLLNYLYYKYGVENCKTLESQYEKYLQEKEERKQYAEAEAKRDYYIKILTEQLSRYRVRYPERFTNRVEALLERKELVEMRHELIIRRQALRKQIDYNNNIVKNTKEELQEIARIYPVCEQEIARKVKAFEGQYEKSQ